MVWVHEGVHGDWGAFMFPFVLEATRRGYVILAPDFRGSTGYGDEYFRKIDYGGMEVDDIIAAKRFLSCLEVVDSSRIGVMGWSHGGLISLLAVLREHTEFKAAAAIVPVSNLVFRLAYKGPAYQREFAPQRTIRGLPFENLDEYVRRSPVFQVNHLTTPLLVHVATNDEDVDFLESQQLIYTLRALKPGLAETKIYENPEIWGGSAHAFSRRVNPLTLERVDSFAQVDSWNRVWSFFGRHLSNNVSAKGPQVHDHRKKNVCQ
jgi:dipeptidyl aminopeptidase/acylaminoacyl peptidase